MFPQECAINGFYGISCREQCSLLSAIVTVCCLPPWNWSESHGSLDSAITSESLCGALLVLKGRPLHGFMATSTNWLGDLGFKKSDIGRKYPRKETVIGVILSMSN